MALARLDGRRTQAKATGVRVPLGEFEVIARYFSRPQHARRGVVLGVGDDAALLTPPAGQVLVAAMDTLVEARHFLPGTPPDAIGHQALAVNLSDLAAMGAEPAWALLSLSLPTVDEAWLEAFAQGLYALAETHGVALVGGDTVRGPLVVTVTVLGFVKAQEALRRSGARPGDALCVSGTPGEAAAGLDLLRSGEAPFDALDRRVRRFLRAQPRLALGRCLRGQATAAMDVSDGLLGDLAKLTAASGVGATLELEHLPVSEALTPYGRERAERYVLTGGDDYELLFTLPAAKVQMLDELAQAAHCSLHRIGTITEANGLSCTRHGVAERVDVAGFDHFAHGGE